jgi:type II secretory pathway pseudopilin PulG
MNKSPSCSKRHRASGFTLVEAMVSTLIFALMSTSLTGLFLQNMRFAKLQTNNVQVINSTFSILDQIKNMGPDALFQAYLNPMTKTLDVSYVDPTNTTTGYRTLTMLVNQTENTVNYPVWSTAYFRTGNAVTSPIIVCNYWVTIRRNRQVSGNIVTCDVLELTLVYRWKVGIKGGYNLGQLQLSFPATNGDFGN